MSQSRTAPVLWLALFAIVWAFYGQTGRDAWRTEEALALGAVMDWLQGTRAVWAEPAPLYTFVAGNLAAWAPWGLSPQDCSRMASGLFTLMALGCVGMAAKLYYGTGQGLAAVLALMGAMGLMLRSHAMVPETALLAVWSCLMLGMVLALRSSPASAWLIGLSLAALGLGMRGLPDLAAGVLTLLGCFWLPVGREPDFRRRILFGMALGAGIVATMLCWLAVSGHFSVWWAWNLYRLDMPLRSPLTLLSDLGWFAWPLWPLALAALWHHHRKLARAPEVLFPLLILAVTLAAAVFPAWSREGSLLPALIPMSLLAAHALEHMRRGAAQAFYWFGALSFAFFAVAFWVYFFAMEWGIPERLAAHLHRLSPTYAPGGVEPWRIGVAIVATALWLVAIPLFPRARIRPILVWATGMVFTWVCIISLFRPWIEAGFAYRPLILELSARLPPAGCLAVESDVAMEVMLRYHLPHRDAPGCDWTLRRVDPAGDASSQEDMEVVWEGRRPRLKREWYRLEHRVAY